MLLLAILLAMLCALVSGDISQRLGDSEFILVEDRVNHAEARSRCHSLGGNLAVPFSSDENDLITNLTLTLDEDDVWLGERSIMDFMEVLRIFL